MVEGEERPAEHGAPGSAHEPCSCWPCGQGISDDVLGQILCHGPRRSSYRAEAEGGLAVVKLVQNPSEKMS